MSTRTSFTITAVIAVAVLFLTLSACAEPPTSVIGDLQAVPTIVAPGGTVALYIDNVTAAAPLTYIWRVQEGEILTEQGTSAIRYRAPDTPGTYVVTVMVSTGELRGAPQKLYRSDLCVL